MLWRLSELAGCAIAATDGPVGRVRDLRVDRAGWAVCGLVIDTGGGTALLSPRLVGLPDAGQRVIPAAVTRAQILSSPRPDADRAGWSARDLARHVVLAFDEKVGRVADLVVDDQGWAIRHLVVGLDGSAGGHTAMVPVDWVARVSAEARAVTLALPGGRPGAALVRDARVRA